VTLASELSDDWDEISAEAGTAVTYGAGAGTTIYGVLTYEEDFDTRRPVLEIHSDDLGTIDHGTALTIATVTYWVEGYRPTPRGMVRLNLRK
jgi:hypothetical protein